MLQEVDKIWKENKTRDAGVNNPREDKLRELTEDTQIPASLEPEQIEKMLLKKKKEKAAKYRRRYAGIAAAACLCVAAGVTAAVANNVRVDRSVGTEDSSGADSGSSAAGSEMAEAEGKIACAADYDQIYDYIQAGLKQQEEQMDMQARMYSDGTASGVNEAAAADSAAMDSASGTGGGQQAAEDIRIRM